MTSWVEDLKGQARHTPKKVRAIWCVDGTTGVDANVGHRPDDAKLTIGAAITVAAAGDLIKVSEDTYDEAVSVPAGLAGLEIICEPGTILVNTAAATVVSIAAPHAKLEGCLIAQAGQIGLAVTGAFFRGKDIIADGCTVGFDMDGANPRLTRCISKNHTVTGFDISEGSGLYNKVFSIGTAAVTGFDLSHTNAELNVFLDCHSLNNTANGFNLIVGADNNTFINCSQSSLCGGPADAGANNSWINWSIESQITGGQSIQEDMSDINAVVSGLATSTADMLFSIDFWSDTQEELEVDAGGGTETLPSVNVAGLPAGVTIVRAVAMFKFRMVENTHAGVNSLNGAQHIQVQSDAPGTWRDAISIVDTLCTLADTAREGGDVWIGDHNIEVEITAHLDDIYSFQWVADALFEFIRFNDIQTGLRIWYSV